MLSSSMEGPVDARAKTELLALTFLMAIIVWLTNRPYEGIWHDSILYSLLAARKLHPEGFSRELFFVFGSQDDLNFFTPLFSFFVSQFGLDLASRATVLLGGLLWCSAFALIGHCFFRYSLPMRFLVLVASALALTYSPNLSVFRLNENFATARVVAMPLSLLAIGFDLKGFRWQAAGLALLATLLHPLHGIWGLLVVVFRKFPPRFLAFGVLLVFSAVLLSGLVYPLPGLELISPEWEILLRSVPSDVFVGNWGVLKIDLPLFWIWILCLAARFGQTRYAALYSFVALMTASAFLLSQVCSYFFPITLIIQAQLWRVLWLSICLGVIALVDVGWRLARQSVSGLYIVIASTILYFALGVRLWIVLTLIGTTFFFSNMELCRKLSKWIECHRRTISYILMVCAITLLPGYLTDLEFSGQRIAFYDSTFVSMILGFFPGGGVGLGYLCVAVIIGIPSLRRYLLLLLFPVLIISWYHWDRRTEAARATEANYLHSSNRSHPLANYISKGDVVYWPANHWEVWFRLYTAHYISGDQATGMLFSKDKTFESKRRFERIAIATMLSRYPGLFENPELALAKYRAEMIANGLDTMNIRKYIGGTLNHAGLAYLCRDPGLDWVVTPSPAQSVRGIKIPPIVVGKDSGQTFALYRCADFVTSVPL